MAHRKKKNRKAVGLGGPVSRLVTFSGSQISEALSGRFGSNFHNPFRNGHVWRTVRQLLGLSPGGQSLRGATLYQNTFGSEDRFLDAVQKIVCPNWANS